jgi:hypothetical protein
MTVDRRRWAFSGQQLAELRHVTQLTQRQLAEPMGVVASRVGAMEGQPCLTGQAAHRYVQALIEAVQARYYHGLEGTYGRRRRKKATPADYEQVLPTRPPSEEEVLNYRQRDEDWMESGRRVARYVAKRDEEMARVERSQAHLQMTELRSAEERVLQLKALGPEEVFMRECLYFDGKRELLHSRLEEIATAWLRAHRRFLKGVTREDLLTELGHRLQLRNVGLGNVHGHPFWAPVGASDLAEQLLDNVGNVYAWSQSGTAQSVRG